jgi:hypothetical protein
MGWIGGYTCSSVFIFSQTNDLKSELNHVWAAKTTPPPPSKTVLVFVLTRQYQRMYTFQYLRHSYSNLIVHVIKICFPFMVTAVFNLVLVPS